MDKTAQVRGKARSFPYRHLAILELEEGFVGEPTMISARAKGVKRIVTQSGALRAGGSTTKSEYVRTKLEYEARVKQLNGPADSPTEALIAELARRGFVCEPKEWA